MGRKRMTATTWTTAALAAVALAACADVLGIDDGIPRGPADATTDATTDAAKLDAGTVDAQSEAAVEAGPPPYSPLSCGTSTCNAVTQGCCSRTTTQTDGAVSYAYACIDDDGGSCDGGQLVTCDRPDNCDKQGHVGDVCCSFETAQPSTVFCTTADSCDYPDGGVPAFRLCEPGDDELCQPDSGKSCLPSIATAVGFLICK
jgi:hypothetical protein